MWALFQELAHSFEEERIRSYTFLCPVCMDDKPIDDCFTASCDHRVCQECMPQFLESKITSGETSDVHIRCPECNEALTTAEERAWR